MKLWKITMTQRGREAFSCSTDFADEFIIRANYPKQVRTIAMKNCGDEGEDIWNEARFSHLFCIGVTTTFFHNPILILRSYIGS